MISLTFSVCLSVCLSVCIPICLSIDFISIFVGLCYLLLRRQMIIILHRSNLDRYKHFCRQLSPLVSLPFFLCLSSRSLCLTLFFFRHWFSFPCYFSFSLYLSISFLFLSLFFPFFLLSFYSTFWNCDFTWTEEMVFLLSSQCSSRFNFYSNCCSLVNKNSDKKKRYKTRYRKKRQHISRHSLLFPSQFSARFDRYIL